MTISYHENQATFSDVTGVEHAEALLEWLQSHPSTGVDLAASTHLHPANLQVLMASNTAVCAWPADAALAGWLKSALSGR